MGGVIAALFHHRLKTGRDVLFALQAVGSVMESIRHFRCCTGKNTACQSPNGE